MCVVSSARIFMRWDYWGAAILTLSINQARGGGGESCKLVGPYGFDFLGSLFCKEWKFCTNWAGYAWKVWYFQKIRIFAVKKVPGFAAILECGSGYWNLTFCALDDTGRRVRDPRWDRWRLKVLGIVSEIAKCQSGSVGLRIRVLERAAAEVMLSFEEVKWEGRTRGDSRQLEIAMERNQDTLASGDEEDREHFRLCRKLGLGWVSHGLWQRWRGHDKHHQSLWVENIVLVVVSLTVLPVFLQAMRNLTVYQNVVLLARLRSVSVVIPARNEAGIPISSRCCSSIVISKF